nr:MAG TPA: hypothetical protein [Crassvirales sp.]
MSNYRRFNNRITNLWMSPLGKLNATTTWRMRLLSSIRV